MKKLFAAIALLAGFIASTRDNRKAFQEQLAARDATIKQRDEEIERLLSTIEDERNDDAALETAASEARSRQEAAEANQKDAEERLAALTAEAEEAERRADALLTQINDDPAIPVVVRDGEVIDESAGRSEGELEADARARENAGQV